jgi:hypothetical protein
MVLSKNTRQGNAEKPLRFRVRPPESQWYPSLEAFLRGSRVISNASPLYELAQSSAEQRARKRTGLEGYEKVVHDSPWLSFVLGSGCLVLSDANPSTEFTLAPLYEAFAALDESDPRLALGAVASEYFERMLVDREVQDGASLASHDPDSPKDWGYTALVILAAALATKIYATALANYPHILTSSYREIVEFDSADDKWRDTKTRFVDPFVDVMQRISDAGTGGAGDRHVLAQLSVELQRSLMGPRGSLLRANVELLTSFAWYFITLGTATYPGWSELLLIEALQALMVTPGDSPARPHLRDLTNETFSTLALESVSRRSWGTRKDSVDATSRDRFFDSVAEVLRQQSEMYAAANGIGARPPMPVAYITSFDLELEMALWAAGAPFVVVLPVLAISEDERSANSASVHWLWTRITPDHTLDHADQLRGIRGAIVEHEWLPADEANWGQSLGKYRGEPVVVRLAGSPLMTVPPREAVGIAADQSLHHALLLDEYSAWHQAVLELSQLRGLAKAFTRATSDVPRFWMFLGTQLSDSAIRIRLLTHEFAALGADNRNEGQQRSGLDDSEGSEESASTEVTDTSTIRAGVVVNRWSRASDRDLFHWHRLDVVQASHRELQPLLEAFISSFTEKRLTQLRSAKVSAA